MNKIFFLIFLIGLSYRGYAQAEFSTKFKTIAPANKAPKVVKPTKPEDIDIPPIDKPNVYKNPDPLKTNSKSVLLDEKKPISMYKTNEFINPGDAVMDKMSKDLNKTLVREGLKEDDRMLVKIDRKFGEIKTKSKYFTVLYRDYIYIDSDLIKATINNQIIGGVMELYANYGQFVVNLNEGINTFEMEAVSKGTSGGNTCEFKIYDDKGVLVRSENWDNWDKGVKGTFVIVKE